MTCSGVLPWVLTLKSQPQHWPHKLQNLIVPQFVSSRRYDLEGVKRSSLGLPGWLGSKESACRCRRPKFDPWVRKIPWRREQQPTAVFWPGESHRQRSLAGYSPWDHKDSEQLTLQHSVHWLEFLEGWWKGTKGWILFFLTCKQNSEYTTN